MTVPQIVAPKEIDFQVPAHADVTLEFQLTDEDGDVIAIGDDTVTFVVFRKRTDTVPLIEKENGPGEHSTPNDGRTVFVLQASDTDFVGKEELVRYEIWRTYEDDGFKTIPWFRGSILFAATRGV
jgi:hypothetical protein